MNERLVRIARAIKAFTENPVTNLVKGALLLLIGLSESSKTLTEDIREKQLRVGHGLVIIGFFGILDALPHFIEGIESGKRYFEVRKERSRPKPDPDAPQEPGEGRAP
jgi:hypothetical protein